MIPSATHIINGVTYSAHPEYQPKEGCGCGRAGAKIDLVPDSFFFGMVSFKVSCCIHDDRYERGGTEEDKIAADREFLDNLLSAVEAVKKWYFPTLWGQHRATNYYAAVMASGNKSFNYHKGENDGSNVVEDSDADRVVVQRGSRNRTRNKRSRDDQYRVQRSKSKRGV